MSTATETGLAVTDGQNVSLIQQNTREKLIAKISDIRSGHESFEKRREIETITRRTSGAFSSLCQHKFKLYPTDLSKLSQEELEELAELVFEKTKLIRGLQLALFLTPILGWMIFLSCGGGREFDNFSYYRGYKKIKALTGENFSPKL